MSLKVSGLAMARLFQLSNACLLSKSGSAIEEYADPAKTTLSFNLEITNNLLTRKGRKDGLVK